MDSRIAEVEQMIVACNARTESLREQSARAIRRWNAVFKTVDMIRDRAQPQASGKHAAPVCVACGAPLRPGVNFCRHCGTPAGPSGNPQTSPLPNAVMEKRCVCGQEIVPDAHFCRYCGRPVDGV
jgi:predicted amidophosphoribosyltransferase